ncbi:unnamed protein product [Rotaria sp. Silwood2]|nr:unnamed protein product [Rotaria sp. Silwood2]
MRHRLLLEVDHNKRFYICHENEMKQKVIEYMNHTGAYMLLQDLNRTDHNYIGRILNTIMQRLTTKLNDLLDRKCISEDQSQQIRMDPSRIRLDFLSFDADTRQTTFFAIFYIDDICTTFSHGQTIQSLERFLNQYVPDRQIQGITIETILELVTFFLQNQYFLYKNKVYRQIKGNGSDSPLTIILNNINMYYQQQNLVNILFEKTEIFGNYVRIHVSLI